MQIVVIVAHGRLIEDVWEFYVVTRYPNHIDVSLTDHHRRVRPTARHKFKFDDSWPWWAAHRKEYRGGSMELKKQPPVPQSVQDELVRKINAALQFKFDTV